MQWIRRAETLGKVSGVTSGRERMLDDILIDKVRRESLGRDKGIA